MINKKIWFVSAITILVLIFALNAALRALTAGEDEAATVAAKVVLGLISLLAGPVIVYNHFTHANQGPITLMQIVLLITSSAFWGLVVERITEITKKRRKGGLA